MKPTCPHGHLRIPDNLIKHGTVQMCRRCNQQACRRWYAKRKAGLTHMADEAALRRIAHDSQTREQA